MPYLIVVSRRLFLIAVLTVPLAVSSPQPGKADPEPPAQAVPVYQLRIYEIFESNKQAFHDRFRDHAARIMARYDFKILAMWESTRKGQTEFVYLLQWPDAQTMADRWAKFMADQEWAAIKKRTAAQHGKLVGAIEDRTLLLTDYSVLTTE